MVRRKAEELTAAIHKSPRLDVSLHLAKLAEAVLEEDHLARSAPDRATADESLDEPEQTSSLQGAHSSSSGQTEGGSADSPAKARPAAAAAPSHEPEAPAPTARAAAVASGTPVLTAGAAATASGAASPPANAPATAMAKGFVATFATLPPIQAMREVGYLATPREMRDVWTWAKAHKPEDGVWPTPIAGVQEAMTFVSAACSLCPRASSPASAQ